MTGIASPMPTKVYDSLAKRKAFGTDMSSLSSGIRFHFRIAFGTVGLIHGLQPAMNGLRLDPRYRSTTLLDQ